MAPTRETKKHRDQPFSKGPKPTKKVSGQAVIIFLWQANLLKRAETPKKLSREKMLRALIAH
jgi:hypothetical protein